MYSLSSFFYIFFFCLAQVKPYDDDLPDHLVGDIGLATYTSNLYLGTYGTQTFFAPYVFANYQMAFARINMFGIKTTKIGYGYLEITGKVILDNFVVKSPFTTTTIIKRYPIPIGIGGF